MQFGIDSETSGLTNVVSLQNLASPRQPVLVVCMASPYPLMSGCLSEFNPTHDLINASTTKYTIPTLFGTAMWQPLVWPLYTATMIIAL